MTLCSGRSMPNNAKRWIFVGLMLLGTAFADEIHLLIDTSGSMKHNDPSNLRRDAVSLLSQLSPQDVAIGLWTFDTQPALLVPAETSADKRKDEIENSLVKITSTGQFTNIESALKAVNDKWVGTGNRHIVLLTDGEVDLGNPEENTQSRKRLLDAGISELKSNKAKLHTIALSPEADKELLKTLAENTGGKFSIAKDGNDLSKIFLGLFDSMSQSELQPVEDSSFFVDDRSTEFTLLMMHGPEKVNFALVSPDNHQITQQDHGQTVSWRSNPSYELVTVSNPTNGLWKVVGAPKDTRYELRSDLKILVRGWESPLQENKERILGVSLTDHGQQVTQSYLLPILKVAVFDSVDNGNPHQIADLPSGGLANGSAQLPVTVTSPGKHLLRVWVLGPTMNRSLQREVEVMPSPKKPVIAKPMPVAHKKPWYFYAMIGLSNILFVVLSAFVYIRFIKNRKLV